MNTYILIANFKLYNCRFGVSCVKFGMLSEANDLVDLMRMVSERGKEIENSQQVRKVICMMEKNVKSIISIDDSSWRNMSEIFLTLNLRSYVQ